MEADGEGNVLATYGWGDTLTSQTRGGETSIYLYDGHGNVRGLLNEEGTLTDTYSYNAYGELTGKTGETENHYLYTGEYYDGMSGLYYLRARYMNPETGTFLSMDTYQGYLYEPVTLHKYLYANGNPVKYRDPSGMFSLPECNIASAISAELYRNQNVILGMSILNGIGKSVMTGLCGGDGNEMTQAFLEGMIEGAAMGMLFCAVAAITVTSLAAVLTSVSIGNTIVNVVLTIYSVIKGETIDVLVYGALTIVGIIESFTMLKVSGHISISGKKGTKVMGIGPDFNPNGNAVQEGINPNSLSPTKDLSSLDDFRMQNAVKYGGNKPIIVDKYGNVLDGHHRLKHAILNDRAVDVSIGY